MYLHYVCHTTHFCVPCHMAGASVFYGHNSSFILPLGVIGRVISVIVALPG